MLSTSDDAYCGAASVADPFGPAALDDPLPVYAQLRSLGPAVLHPERNVWLVTRYDAVRHVLRHPEAFSSAEGIGYVRAGISGLRAPLNDSDPPDHTRVRRLVQRWFTPTAVEEHRPWLRAMSERLVDEVVRLGSFDAMEAVARPLPVAVMADLLGMRHPDPTAVSAMMDSAFHILGPDPEHEHLARVTDMVVWLLQQGLAATEPGGVAERIMTSETDLIERVSLVDSIWIAGVDTTTNLIGSLFHVFAQHPEQWRLVVADPALALPAVEEALRFASPIRSFMRRTPSPCDLLGVPLPGDADVAVFYASANRDPEHYPDPDRFDVRRNPVDHLAFGAGIHLCLGAPFLRIVAGELVRAMRTRIDAIHLDGDPVANPSPVIQGFLRLPVRVQAAAR